MEVESERVPSSSIRTFLLIENRLMREALVRLFCKRSDFLVVGQSGHVEGTVSRVLDSQCDVLVLDSLQLEWLPASTPPQSGDHAFRAVAIGMDSDEKQFLAAARSGVTGYLLQDASARRCRCARRLPWGGRVPTSALFHAVPLRR
jgi:DNA-binding NarL/FixJ family response regulator